MLKVVTNFSHDIELCGNSTNHLRDLPINEKGIVSVELISERCF